MADGNLYESESNIELTELDISFSVKDIYQPGD